MKKTLLAVALTTAMGGAQAAVWTIDAMDVTGGTFEMPGVTTFPIEYGGDNFIGGNSTVTAFGPNTNLTGGYIGNGGGAIASDVQDPDSIVAVNFFGNPVNTFTALSNLGDDVTPAGTLPGGSVPTGTFCDSCGSFQMDMNSFFANWNGTDFNQGALATGSFDDSANGTLDDGLGSYSMSWSKLITGGSFDGKTGFWVMTGDITASTVVPVPAAAWLFGSGLVGLVAVARRKKAQAV